MAKQEKVLLAFNRGVISPRGLARVDLERMAMSADQQTNWMPRVLGSMMLRPGLEHIGNINGNNVGRQIPFTFGVDDTAQLEISANGSLGRLRVRIDDVLITRPTVTTVITNPGFGSDLTGWTDDDEGGTAVSAQVFDAFHGGVMSLIGDGENAAVRTQEVTVIETGVEHAIDLDVVRGVVGLRVGSTDGDDDYVAESLLGMGNHQMSFTPSGNFWIQVSNVHEHEVWVSSIDMSASGNMFLSSPWDEVHLPKLRWEQSGDVIYVAADGTKQYKIERRGDGRSWSIVEYFPENGPFRVQNTGPIDITPSAISGQITLTASKPLFRPGHANHSLFRMASSGQTVTNTISAQDTFTPVIRVVGAEAARVFAVIIENLSDSTVTLQFAFSDDGPWNDTSPQYTVDFSDSYDDGQDDQIIFYRLGIKTGDYGTDTVTCTLNYTGGSIQGVVRINGYVSRTSVTASVLSDLGATTATKDWWEGEWSDHRGYPSAVALHEGRLWWAGNDKIFGSVSDGYENWDDNTVGDSGPISRSIGFGPIRIIHWLMSMGRLLFGTSDNSSNIAAAKMDGNNPLGARSNSFDEPLTPTNFNIKTISSRGLFVDRTEQRLHELLYDIDQQDYKSQDLTVFAPDYNKAGIVQIAVQIKPDLRVHCVRADGTAGVLIYDRLENVICWCEMTSPGADGVIEDVSVLPGTVEDQVYYVIKRTINSSTERHLCKWALESEAIGGQLSKIADSFTVYDGAATITPFTTELLHLRGETVVIWADGRDIGTDVVTDTGALTNNLAVAASKVVAGLGYMARFKSSKLGDLTGFSLLERKHVQRIGFIAENMHYQGLQYGPRFSGVAQISESAWGESFGDAWGDSWGVEGSVSTQPLWDLPQEQDGLIQPPDTIYATYHEDDFAFGGEWDTDSRICLQAEAPRPVTILAAIAVIESVEERSNRRR